MYITVILYYIGLIEMILICNFEKIFNNIKKKKM